MKKSVFIGMISLFLSLSANEIATGISKQNIEKKGLHTKHVQAKVQEKTFVKQEPAIKRQNYPRGNIATH